MTKFKKILWKEKSWGEGQRTYSEDWEYKNT